MCGEIGVLATATLIYHYQNKDYGQLLRNILSFHPNVCCIESNLPDEVLYGRAGYLYTLLFLRSKIPNLHSTITDHMIRQVICAILDSGKKTSQNLHSKWPLTYVWHDKPYVGGAHGYGGILYMLLEAVEHIGSEELVNLIRPTLDMIVDQQFSSGNFPPCLGETDDKLLHWCHGGPGLVYLLATAESIFNDGKYLQAALKAGNDIWQRGLLRKGYGLCHGTTGNAYAFLRLYRLTNDERHLHRAIKFTEWCCHYGQHGCRTPDRPYSLMEGMAGTLYFFLDIINPFEARFPAFQL
ncbi:lanC-like protein 2-like protein [Euroglyphus maynei]|uniref:LanC-like protein 2-like protein n=1 Tax=Euroglyphus maynei TaxID=6958 RepID=A0A1Y3ASM0_EURMA|nr:lanC-like protein 2-like protein [Euroglyphus maynei]